MTDVELKAKLTDRSVLAITAVCEAQGDAAEGHSSVEERIAVMCVARNRLAAYRTYGAHEPTYRSVCLAPQQFSCWQPIGGDANYSRAIGLAERIILGLPLTDRILQETLFLADGIMAGVLIDNTGHADHYYAPRAMKPAGRIPTWAIGKRALQIGSQRFLSLVEPEGIQA